MSATSPQAFVSFTSKDRETALRTALSLERAGFEVWHMDKRTSTGDNWQDEYERQMLHSHAMVAIVSPAYLRQPQCINEVRDANGRFTENKMLVAPILVEPVDKFDNDAGELAFGRLMKLGGLADGRSPSDAELDAMATALARQVREKGLWSPDSQELIGAESAIEPTLSMWDEILGAAEEGHFVPVLGFDVAASTDYADAQSTARLGCSEETVSAQRIEEAQVRRLLDQIEEAIAANGGAADVAGYDRYVDALRAQWLDQSEDDCCQIDDATRATPATLVALQRSLVLLAAGLTSHWAQRLRLRPSPLGARWSDFTAPLSERSPSTPMIYARIRDCLDAARELATQQESPLTGSLRTEDATWIYVKLLILTAHVIGPSRSFWELPDDEDDEEDSLALRRRALKSFTDRHRKAIQGLSAECEWDVRSDVLPVPNPSESTRAHTVEIGVRLSHLVWLENLLRFTLLSQTRAYRTRSDYAFALTLCDDGTGIPRMPADPYEIGLLHSSSGRPQGQEPSDDPDALTRLARYADDRQGGEPRRPGAFHIALARLARLHERTAVDTAVILVMGFDQEMERALEVAGFEQYRVAVPVSIRLGGQVDAGEGGSEQRPFVRPTRNPRKIMRLNTWLLGLFERQDQGVYRVKWMTLDDASTYADAGPLVIKLFGSPAHDLPTSVAEIAGKTQNFDARDRPRHRLVLDEMEVIDAILKHDFSQIEGLQDQLASSMFVCFGQDALTWGDRAAYLLVEAIRSRRASDSESPMRFGRGQRHPVVAAARRSNRAVKGLWQRLNVEHLEIRKGEGDLAGRIVAEVERLVPTEEEAS